MDSLKGGQDNNGVHHMLRQTSDKAGTQNKSTECRMLSDHFHYTPITPHTTSHNPDRGQEPKERAHRPTGAPYHLALFRELVGEGSARGCVH